MTGNGIKLGRWFGIEVTIDLSWLVIAFLVSWSFYSVYITEFPTLQTSRAIVLGGSTALLFFLSVLLHELSHSVVARSLGIPVEGITLFVFGGVTRTTQEARSPGQELAVAIVGPLTSVALAGIFWALVELTGDLFAPSVAFGLGYLGWINLAVGVFNMLPGFPLDGGRVLRSILWKATGSAGRATTAAAGAGRVLGAMLIAVGILVVFGGNLGGLWYAAIGWFLMQAATGAGQEVVLQRMLRGVTAGDLMSPNPVTLPATATLRDAVDDHFLRYDHSAFPVEDETGAIVGILTLRAVRQVPRDQWELRQAWAAMTPIEDACTVGGDLPMDEVLQRLREHDHERVLVVESGRVVGIITARDISRWVRRSDELGLEIPTDA